MPSHDRIREVLESEQTVELAGRWQAHFETPYAELSEQQQESDREQVRRYLPTVIDALTG